MRCATKGVIESNHGMPSSRKGSSCATVSAIKSNLSMPSIPRMSCATTGAIECGLKGEEGGEAGEEEACTQRLVFLYLMCGC